MENAAAYKACRWVVERTDGWLNRFRRLLIQGKSEPTPI
jgi:transposase